MIKKEEKEELRETGKIFNYVCYMTYKLSEINIMAHSVHP